MIIKDDMYYLYRIKTSLMLFPDEAVKALFDDGVGTD